MGKFDRRNSMKMRRRKGQVKKKARLARHRAERKAPGTAVKKTRKAPAAPKSNPPA